MQAKRGLCSPVRASSLARMKLIAGGLVAVIALMVLAGVGLSLWSRRAPDAGLQDGRLRPCPETPNCVCSETTPADAEHAVRPLDTRGSPEAWELLQSVIAGLGGTIVSGDGHYLYATFTTPWFRYVDDVEARLDATVGLIHIRSASRVGRSDLGLNRRRVETIRRHFERRLQQTPGGHA